MSKNLKKSKAWNGYFLFVVLAFVLSYTWFKGKFLLAHAEEGLPFYEPNRTFNLYKNIWLDQGLGTASPFLIPRLTLYGFASVLQSLGITTWFIQAITFFFIILTPLIFIPKLTEIFFPKRGKLVGFLAALFYLFNFFSASQVFNRFIYVFMFTWSYLPLFLYLWIKWLRDNNLKFLLYLVLSSFVFSYAFGLPSAVFVFWIPAFLFVFYDFSILKQRQVLGRTAKAFIVWIIFNLWWVYPLWSLRGNTYSEMLDPRGSITSITEVSQYYDNKDILYLKQKYYFEREGYFKTFATSRRVKYAANIFLFFMVIGMASSLRNKKLFYFLLLLIVGWFVSKGTNPPFGKEFYEFLFNNIKFTQVLRNPYEKFGVVFLLAYSILAASGVYFLCSKFLKEKLGVYVSYLITMIIVFVLGMPILKGDIFFGHYYIKVPEYYEEANKLIKGRQDGKILHLPYRSVPGIKYAWGYAGEDTSLYLFDNPSISGTTSLKGIDEYLYILPRLMNSSGFTNILNTMNVDFIVIHHDLVQDASYSGGAEYSKELVSGWKNVDFMHKIDVLEIYKVGSNDNLGYVYAVNSLNSHKNLEDALGEIAKESFNSQDQAVFIKAQNKNEIIYRSSANKPNISYRKLNAQRYKVEVSNAQGPFILILSSSFNELWKASASDKEVFTNHFVVNGYANGWIVDKKGDYEIDIVFKVWPWE